MNHMIINEKGQEDYAGEYERPDEDICPECGGKLIDGVCEDVENIYHENI